MKQVGILRRSHWLSLLVGATLLCAASGEASAAGALRYRQSGTYCKPTYGAPGYAYSYYEFLGMEILDSFSDDDSVANVTCPIPLGYNLVELNDTNSRMLDRVSIRLQLTGGSDWVSATLVAHDHDSMDYCVCDTDVRNDSAGYFSLSLEQVGDADTTGCDTGCPGGTLDSSWGLNTSVFLGDYAGGSANTLLIKLISVYDT